MNNDQIKSRLEQVKGKVKKVTPNATGNSTLQDRTRVEAAAGNTRADYGTAKDGAKGAS
jgi:uncharacterized protein YjbJ (UPF0337 family)